MDQGSFAGVIEFIRSCFPAKSFIPLHEPLFVGNEKKYVNDCIDSTFVSSVGEYVGKFENLTCQFTGAAAAVATMNGTAALHAALCLMGVKGGDEVITQPLTFVATCNAISYTGASPVFVDVDRDTLGMSPQSLGDFFERFTQIRDGVCYNKGTGKRIAAVIPMHTFGHPCRIDEIVEISHKYSVPVIEDAAESLGSYYKGKHTGLFGDLGVFSYNGNKTITTGGGGMIVTNDVELGKRAKHLTTTAKKAHPYEYNHDMVGFNYRLPNLNAALGCAQMENLPIFLESKRALAEQYKSYFKNTKYQFVSEPTDSKSNYWLAALLLNSKEERDTFLKETNASNVMTRPIWSLMTRLEMFKSCQSMDLPNAEWIESRLVNLPSSAKADR